jgi:hypothetical protein
MTSFACMWCETTVSSGTINCPECGLHSPAAALKAAPTRGSSKVVHRGRRVALAVIAVPLMLSAAYAERGGSLPLVPLVTAVAVVAPVVSATQPPAAYSDPLQRSVWISGAKAVQQALAQPGYSTFAGSYVNVAAGHVVSFCGQVANTAGNDSLSGGQRFISVFGQSQSTTLESNDPSFPVLWNRVCAQPESNV